MDRWAVYSRLERVPECRDGPPEATLPHADYPLSDDGGGKRGADAGVRAAKWRVLLDIDRLRCVSIQPFGDRMLDDILLRPGKLPLGFALRRDLLKPLNHLRSETMGQRHVADGSGRRRAVRLLGHGRFVMRRRLSRCRRVVAPCPTASLGLARFVAVFQKRSLVGAERLDDP